MNHEKTLKIFNHEISCKVMRNFTGYIAIYLHK